MYIYYIVYIWQGVCRVYNLTTSIHYVLSTVYLLNIQAWKVKNIIFGVSWIKKKSFSSQRWKMCEITLSEIFRKIYLNWDLMILVFSRVKLARITLMCRVTRMVYNFRWQCYIIKFNNQGICKLTLCILTFIFLWNTLIYCFSLRFIFS